MYRLYTAPFDTEHVSNSLIIKMGKLGPRDRMTCLHPCSPSGLQDSTGLKVDYTVESLVKLERFITNLSLIFPMSKWENTYLAGLFQGFSMKIPPTPFLECYSSSLLGLAFPLLPCVKFHISPGSPCQSCRLPQVHRHSGHLVLTSPL